ncbi:MAG: hypothetical protein L0210_09565 [Rhodospirillales bacterium]|nr:hypothetical protein [Rhodospirillales bacterium]
MAITSVGAAGASSATNGSAPAPGLPSGLAAGDVMVCVFYSREATDGTVSISAGWTQIVNDRTAGGLLGAWFRVFQAGDAAPTFTLGGHATGNSGDTAIAQIAAWRGCDQSDPLDITGTISTNASAQNIGAIAGITLAANDAVIVVGGKRDDWTSVTALSGDSLTWAEIGEPDTTSGADAGLVWDYAIDGGSGTTVTSKTFTVTGGAAADGKGVMFSLNVAPPAQTISGAGGIATAEAFGSGKVNLSAAPSAIVSAEAFGAAKLNLAAAGAGNIASAEAFGSGKVNLAATPSAIASAEAFGTAKLNLALTGAGAIASAEALGTPIVSTPGGAQTLSGAGGIASAEAFGTAAISAAQAAAGAGPAIGPRIIFVSSRAPQAQALGPAGIGSAEAFGIAAVTSIARVAPASIAQAGGFGIAKITSIAHIAPASIAPRSAVGRPALRMRRPKALRQAEERGLLLAA